MTYEDTLTRVTREFYGMARNTEDADRVELSTTFGEGFSIEGPAVFYTLTMGQGVFSLGSINLETGRICGEEES